MRITIVLMAWGVAGLVEQAGGEWLAAAITIVAILEYFAPQLRTAKETGIALFARAMDTKAGRIILVPLMLLGSFAGAIAVYFVFQRLGVFELVAGLAGE